MRRSRKQPYILVLLVICNLCCNASVRTTWCERVEDLDNTLCRFEDLSDSVLIDICERIEFHHKPNPTRDQIVRIARNFCFPFKEAQDNNNEDEMIGSLLNDLQYAQEYVPSVACNKAEDIKLPICTYEDLKDEVLLDMCKKIGYHHKPNPTREQLVLTAPMCRVWTKSLDKSDDVAITKFLIADIVDEFFEGHEQLQLLYKSHIDMLKDASYIAMSRNDRVNYILSKHNVDGEEKSMRTLLREKLEEEDLHLTLGIDTKVKEQWIERYIPTRREIAKLPDWYSYKLVIKGEAIKIKIFQKDGDAVTSQWSAESQTWSNPRPITLLSESNYNNRLFVDLMKKSMQYENVLLFQSDSDGGESGPQLSKETLVIGFNHGDEPHSTAMRVLREYKLRDNKLRYTHGDDEAISGAHLLISITDFLLKYASEATPPAGKLPKLVTFVLVLLGSLVFVLVVIPCIASQALLLVPKRKKRKKAMKPDPKKSPLLCHQPVIKKTIYVKSFAIKRLNRGNRLNGVVTRSRAQDIHIERKTGQPTVMNKIEASNGVVYVPVHIKGSEEAVQKAVVLIQEAVGKENVDEEIELPPTNPKQATRHPKKVSSSTPPKKKKESLSSTLWSSVCARCQSLKEISINTCQSTRNIWTKKTVEGWSGKRIWITVTVIFAILCCAVKLNVVCMISRGIDDKETYCQRDIRSGEIAYDSLYFLVLGAIFYNLLVDKHMQTSKFDLVIFGSLYCVFLFAMEDGCEGNGRERNDKCVKVVAGLMNLFVAILLTRRLWKRLCPMLVLAFGIISGALRKPFEIYHAKKIKHTIYVKSSKSNNLSSKQGKKKKDIINKSGVDDIQIESTNSSHEAVHLTGSRQSVRKAIEMIQEAVGKKNVSTTKPSNTMSVQESVSATVNTSEPQPNQKSTTESPVQCETKNASGNKLARESTAVESPLDTAVQEEEEEEVPSEIGINSCQGMTRETITEASISSLNNRSNASKAYSNFTLNETDPLLIFLRSQQSCIKGSVDEFYTWLVKSEDIDSMMALKEAVNEDDYLNDMKVGDGGGSGIKGFKRKAFLRAISEYFNDESDTKSSEVDERKSKASSTASLNEPPEELVCPISLNLMTNDPVVAADSITYERASIEDWFEKSKAKISEAEENLKQNPHSEADQRVVENGICSPVYGSKLESLVVTPNTSVRNMARAYKEKMSID